MEGLKCLVFDSTHLTLAGPHFPHRDQHFTHSLVKFTNPRWGGDILHLEFAISALLSNPEMNKHIITSLVFHVGSSNQVRGFYHAF